MIYRCDAPSGPLCDLLGVRLSSRYASALMHAREHVDRTGEAVTITRIGRAGHLSHAVTVRPVRSRT